jgi:sugar phosphate isomerase/epimerase
MQFGICTVVENAHQVQAAGWDFVEVTVPNLLEGQIPDDQWKGLARVTGSPLPILAANMLVPAALKICGPAVDSANLGAYIKRVVARAQAVGIKTLVFGSGGARAVPDGFDRSKARAQILDFMRMVADLAAGAGITLVAEPLNSKESNIINTVAEAITYVQAVNHPRVKCLVDSFHFWKENEPLENVVKAGPWLWHVHVADKSRVPPGQSDGADYRPFFHALKAGSYAGPISVEASDFDDIPAIGPRVLEFLKKQWDQA